MRVYGTENVIVAPRGWRYAVFERSVRARSARISVNCSNANLIDILEHTTSRQAIDTIDRHDANTGTKHG